MPCETTYQKHNKPNIGTYNVSETALKSLRESSDLENKTVHLDLVPVFEDSTFRFDAISPHHRFPFHGTPYKLQHLWCNF